MAAKGLRHQDDREVRLLGFEPRDALYNSWKVSFPHVYAGVIGGDPFTLFGVGEIAPRAGRPWLLSTKDVLKVKRQFMAHTLPWLHYFNVLYPYLENFVHVQNTVAVRWLEYAGFELQEDTMKVGETHFRRFTRTLTP
jgi:hypothetical protein